jgi:hypothetical protein
MRNLTLRLLVAVITLSVGIAAGNTWSRLRNSPAKHQRCRDGLVTVEQQPDAPLRISILSLDCASDFANIGYQVEGRTTRLIKAYEVHISKAHQGIIDSDAHGSMSLSTPGAGLTSSEIAETSWSIDEKLSRGFFRTPVDQVTLYVSSVTFADGTGWHRALTSNR